MRCFSCFREHQLMTANSFHGLVAGEETSYPAALSLILERTRWTLQLRSPNGLQKGRVSAVWLLPLRRDGARCSLDAGKPHTRHPEPASHLQHQITHIHIRRPHEPAGNLHIYFKNNNRCYVVARVFLI